MRLNHFFCMANKCFLKSAVLGYSNNNETATIHVLPLLVTADMKAHAEIGLSCAGGQKGCRRCKIVGEYVLSCKHYYYGNFSFRYYN